MFTLKLTPIDCVSIQLESKFNYDEGLSNPIGRFKKLSDIWKPSYFCWSKHEVENHLDTAIETCDDLILISFGTDIKKINDLRSHLNDIRVSIHQFKLTDTFRY